LYRRYALERGGRVERHFREYFSDLRTEAEQDDWRTVNLDAARDVRALLRDFGR
jgi:hypothetical protein